jgi:hypothetical protein
MLLPELGAQCVASMRSEAIAAFGEDTDIVHLFEMQDLIFEAFNPLLILQDGRSASCIGRVCSTFTAF